MKPRHLLIVLAALMAGCAGEPAKEAARNEGASLFAAHCAVCHGTTGDGSGQVPSRVDFTSRSWQQYRSDDDIRSAIRSGVKGTAMPAFPALNEQQVDALVAHLRTLRRR
ncbi:MAG: cytochrome c [Thermoanaerobaculia bacterium]